MRVLYDISVLGIGYHDPCARTGVFRVVENLAYGLNAANSCELYFCSSDDAKEFYYVKKYLDDTPNWLDISLTHGEKKLTLYSKLFDLQTYFDNKIENASSPSNVPLKIFRKAISLSLKLVNPSLDVTKTNLFKNADIYHTPFSKIPKTIQNFNRPKKFLTIYDLIPILYPNFFNFSEDSIVKDSISSLDSESWVLSISHVTKNDLCNYSKAIDPDKVIVTHLAASDSFYPFNEQQKSYEIRQKYSIPDAPYILSLSTLEPRKNIDHTIRCFLKLVQQEKLSDLNLVLVGTKGWNYDKIFAEISNNSHLEDRIIVTGYVADEDLAPLYSGALAFVYPSFYEGFGLPPLEAMQCGVPVITSNTSSLPEVVGDAGIMLDPKDEDGLCHSLLNLYNDENLRASMAEQSLKQAKKFSWEKCTQETINAYKIALNA
jgi:glycosyltransferase involved in cell wall biosynthesis